VEANYVEGKPRHHLPAARNIEYEPGSSMFFIVDHADYAKLKPQVVQEIYRHRNIVIRNAPQRTFNWSPETLGLVGSCQDVREIQGRFISCTIIISPELSTVGECRGNPKVEGMLKSGTLQDIYDNASERVLNCLSLPMSATEVIPTPGLQYVSIPHLHVLH